MRIISAILDLLFPPKCIFCSKILSAGEYWCEDCAGSLLLTADGGRQAGEFYEFCLAPLYYTGSVRKSVLRYKFRGARGYADAYGKILASCIREHLDVEYDIISWVPLSRKRKRERGYDQAFLLASAVAEELGQDVAETLTKPKNIGPQSELKGKDERVENISGAYEVSDLQFIKNKCILIIDDIVTTGSTLEECAKELIKGGAKKVVCAALARGSQS